MTTFIVILAAIFLVALVAGLNAQANQDIAMSEGLQEIQKAGIQFTDSTKLYNQIIGWDTQNRKIALITAIQKQKVVTVFDFDALRDSEIIKDGVTVQKKSAMRTVGGAVVGGVLLGGVGAIVGGLSGGSKSQEKITALSLKIYFNSIEQPSQTISFISEATPEADKKIMISEAEKWNDRLSAIIDENNKRETRQNHEYISLQLDKQNNHSPADELRKFKELLEQNAISQEEYDIQKKRLLNM